MSHNYFMHVVRSTAPIVSSFWKIPGMRTSMLMGDLMHCGDLGISQAILANILLDLVYSVGGSISQPDQACFQLMSLIFIGFVEVQ